MNPRTKRMLTAAGFGEQVKRTEHGFCAFCAHPVTRESFHDPESWNEYRISGLCQECQDKVFA